jgi:ParB-like chromosome segregation protein Spo0J
MTDEEVAAFAADIAENGQTDPIVVGQIDGARGEFLVDGRNRVKACEIVGIEPAIEKRKFKNDDEVRAFVKSGGERRDITKGQRAMAHALLYPDAEKAGRGKKGKASQTDGFSATRVREARAVLRYSRDLALAVRDGIIPLDEEDEGRSERTPFG